MIAGGGKDCAQVFCCQHFLGGGCGSGGGSSGGRWRFTTDIKVRVRPSVVKPLSNSPICDEISLKK